MTPLRTRILPALLGLALILPLAAAPASAAKAAKTAAAAPAAAAGPVDLNSASQKDLEALPGVGAATAKKIIAGRPYASVADLAKAGVSAKTIQKITPLVTAGPAASAPAAPAAPAPKAAPVPQTTSAPKAPKAPKMTPMPGAKVDLNTASEKALEGLPKVGPATAKKIVAGRPYASVQDLARAGVPAKTIETITPLVTVSVSAAAPAPIPMPAPAPTPAQATASAPAETVPPTAQAVPPPAKGMVWVNLDSKIFHREGDPWYGRTKHGQYMSEADAAKAGYREAKKGGRAKGA
jgi:competence protein ComEA